MDLYTLETMHLSAGRLHEIQSMLAKRFWQKEEEPTDDVEYLANVSLGLQVQRRRDANGNVVEYWINTWEPEEDPNG